MLENNRINILTKIKFIDSFTLKIIAITMMLIDHIGHILLPEISWLRMIGRISFPIFCFLIVEGYYYTSNIKKYMLRLFILGVISEIPYDIAIKSSLWYPSSQNVLFTLLLGLILIYLYENNEKILYRIVCATAVFMVTYLLNPDYNIYGICMIFCFYYFRYSTVGKNISVSAISLITPWLFQCFAILALIPINLYNGNKGKSLKYIFYIFYPVHLLILAYFKYFIYQ